MAENVSDTQHLFTCLSCSIAFHSAEDQRIHYRSDYHRYNMKRRIASLPPVSAAVFNQKVLDRKLETAIMSSARGSSCSVCNKIYTTENAYRSHIQSKKHKDNELKASIASRTVAASTHEASSDDISANVVAEHSNKSPQEGSPLENAMSSLAIGSEETEEDITKTIDEKIAAARARLSTSQCLFCSVKSDSLPDNLSHMSVVHSFFIPDAEYLVDKEGLITYLGEKIAVGNVCIYCNEKGREFRTVDAVRKHMVDKSHCKIAYDSEADRLEISDFYDFSTSYPDHDTKTKTRDADAEADEWEDVDDNTSDDQESVGEIVDESESGSESDLDDVPDNQLKYGDSPFELVLPSGARIGHRSMRRYYAQSLVGGGRSEKSEDPNSGAALVRRLLADKNSALVPRKGGFGAYGSGTDVVKARNRGEAREAGRHVREFRDQRRREEFRTRVGFIHNSQKHYRDPLLQ